MNNQKRIIIPVILFMLMILVIGTTYSFFNYTRTGGANTVRTGRIYFNSEEDGKINLTNAFPETREEALANNSNNSVTINITGDTKYSEGIEYLLTISDVNNTINDKKVPISLIVNNDNVFGVEDDDYFVNRGGNTNMYKKMFTKVEEGNQIFVGYIKSGETGINGNITIKAYVDADRIAISDTYDGTESGTMGTTTNWVNNRTVFTTEEWNSLKTAGVSFKIKVEANECIWVEEPLTSYTQITRNVLTPTNPINFANISSSSNGEGLYILPGTENDPYPIYYYRGAVTNNNVIFGEYCWQMVRTTDTGGIKMIYNGAVTGNGETCENTAHADRVLTSNSAFNSQYNTIADVGYMKNNNARYTYTNVAGETGSIYGKKVEWDGNNYLVIDDTANTASTNTTKDNNHHYSCGTAGTTSCGSVRYYYYDNYYITLTGGDFVEDAIYKMTGSIVNQDIDVVTRNPGYVLNNTDSTIKTSIESWFRTNLTNEVDNTKINYVNYLEDTVYCNDRSVKTVSGNTSYPTYQESGWNPSGGDLTKYLYFETWNRYQNNWYSTTNVPSVACPNETDRFSLGSSVAHLNYPVGLLTVDEIVMAGASGNSSKVNKTYYLYTGGNYWSLSPYSFFNINACEFTVYSNGSLVNGDVRSSHGVRPVVSLKPGTEFESGGDGTPTNPYIVKYE